MPSLRTLTSGLGLLLASAAASAQGLPSWYPQEAGRVVAIPALPGHAVIEDVVPVPTAFGRPVRNLIGAWNGGTLIQVRGVPYLAIHGGGHGDYAGNEIAMFGPLTADRPGWSLLSPPTPQGLVNRNGPHNRDGTPNVSHTRDTLCFLDGKIYRALQSGIFDANTSWDTFDSFDVATRAWANHRTHPNVPAGGGHRGSAVADPTRHVVWMFRDGVSSKLKMFDPASNTWTGFQSTYTTRIETSAAFSASRDEIFLFDNRAGPRQMLFDLGHPNADPSTAGFSGTPPPDKCGLVWDEALQLYAALGTADRRIVFQLDPVTRTWTSRAFVGPTEPQPDDANGIFGRFQYVARLRGYVYVGATDGSVYFYRSS